VSRPDPFADVYRVTTKLRPVPPAEVDALARDLGVPLPDGYRGYVTTFGSGELCDLLRVWTPDFVRERIGPDAWERESYVEGVRQEAWESGVLTPEDAAEAVTFGDTVEGDSFVGCPRFGGVLYELPRHHHVIRRFEDGFYGVVADTVARMRLDFAYFEPDDTGRRHRSFTAGPDSDGHALVAEVVRRWGEAGVRRSRSDPGEAIPTLFVSPIGGRLTLYLNGRYTGLLPGCFPVAMSYDAEHEADVADFVGRVGYTGCGG
jgi:hypothetical protein